MVSGMILDRFRSQYGTDFWCTNTFCSNQRKPPKCLYIKHLGGFSTCKISHFLIKSNQKIILFLMALSGCHFFIFWRILVPKLSILGSLWRPAGPKMIQNRPSGAKNLKFMKRCNAFFGNLEQACDQGRFRSAPGHHFGWFSMDFDIIFDGFWLLLCSSICRMSKPPGTKRNSGKHQEHVDNCRNMQTSSARKSKSLKSDRDTASCRMQIAATNANLQIRGRRCSRR